MEYSLHVKRESVVGGGLQLLGEVEEDMVVGEVEDMVVGEGEVIVVGEVEDMLL